MYPIDHKVPIVDLAGIRKPHYQIPLDTESAYFDEPLVNLCDYDLPFISWHAISDGSNPPYHKPVRGSRQEDWLHKTVAQKLERANKRLHEHGVELLILDAYRPIACQRGLWEFFYELGRRETPGATEDELLDYAQKYVLDPRKFDPLDARTLPIHITGSSIDCVLCDHKTGASLDMGSQFEEMVPASISDHFERELLAGNIAADDQRLWNRRLLNWALGTEGFLNDPRLHWHYDWGNQIWIKVNKVVNGDGPDKAWYGHIEDPPWEVEAAA